MSHRTHMVVTPYTRERVSWVRACNESVLGQNVPACHVLVADGARRMDLAAFDAIAIGSPVQVDDRGGTSRAIGGRWALGRGAETLSYLDAGDWFDRAHVENAAWAIDTLGADIVISGVERVAEDASRTGDQGDDATLGMEALADGIGATPDGAVGPARKISAVASAMTLSRSLFRFVESWRVLPREMAEINQCLFTWLLFSAAPTVVWTCRRTAFRRPKVETDRKPLVAGDPGPGWRSWYGLDTENRGKLWRRMGGTGFRIPTVGDLGRYVAAARRTGGMVKWEPNGEISVVRARGDDR